ncbi:hypothetical protein G5I_10712 [Acromyrmex echinatior]|uniref:Uncharacterized protein n=1 Tax=Acromyrmex echinatior TaxID=103372 RepID=F4WXM6_ACREC|nr:hypothetical protein G5I_10712 [Acromyrmex echinatior]
MRGEEGGDENIPGAENYVARNCVAGVCGNLCLRRGDDMARVNGQPPPVLATQTLRLRLTLVLRLRLRLTLKLRLTHSQTHTASVNQPVNQDKPVDSPREPAYTLNKLEVNTFPSYKTIPKHDPRRFAYKLRDLFGTGFKVTLPLNYPILPSESHP